MMITLDKRLGCIASLARQDKPVCDIGTDHALLPCYLKQQGQRVVVASDINEKPLRAAADTMRQYGISDITLVQSDGLRDLPFYPDADIIIAGMGGETIANILADYLSPTIDQRFILQPMTKHRELRVGLYQSGYEILSEHAVIMGERCYTIIYAHFVGKIRKIDDTFSFIGKQEDERYIKNQLEKLYKMSKGDKKLLKVIEEVEKMVTK